MPGWFRFTSDYDHHWQEGGVTAFKAGMVLNVKNEVLEGAKAAGAGEDTDKPEDTTEGYIPTPTAYESRRTKPGNHFANVKAGGRGYDKSGNPVTVAELPPAHDPEAVRSEPLVETDRVRTGSATGDGEEQSESQVPAE